MRRPVRATITPARERRPDYFFLLSEYEVGYNYARAGEETLDLCLSKLFAAMSEDEYRHAELLMKLLGRKMNV